MKEVATDKKEKGEHGRRLQSDSKFRSRKNKKKNNKRNKKSLQ